MSITRTAALVLRPAAFFFASAGWAQSPAVPPGFVASPEIYKVIAENDKYRIIEVTWKVGQKDKPHSHPEAGVYNLTACTTRSTRANGEVQEGTRPAGTARINGAVVSHTVENVGTAECKVLMFEPK
jgi:hypothetical protein